MITIITEEVEEAGIISSVQRVAQGGQSISFEQGCGKLGPHGVRKHPLPVRLGDLENIRKGAGGWRTHEPTG